MEITEVRVKLVNAGNDKLKAFCSITLDDKFVVRDLKIIDGSSGPSVAMPSRKLSDRCPRCRAKNHLRASFCNECGARLSADRAEVDPNGRSRLHADIAHPIRASFRELVEGRVLAAFEEELENSKQPGYKPPAESYADDDDVDHLSEMAPPPPRREPRQERDGFSSGIF